MSDEERQAIFSRGEFKTIIQKDSVYYEEHDVTVIALESVGTKYIHGLVCHKDREKIEPNYWVASFEKANSQIFDGQRWDLVDKSTHYRSQRHDYMRRREEAKRQVWYECESRARQECAEIMAKWDLENPSPKDPFDTA